MEAYTWRSPRNLSALQLALDSPRSPDVTGGETTVAQEFEKIWSGSGSVRLEQSGAENLRPMAMEFPPDLDLRTSTDGIKSLRLITAVKTPYLPDGRFDLEAYDSLINMQINGGAEGVIVGGTTGEGHLMNWDEHIMLIGHTVNCFGANIKVIGNTGSNSTREAVHATEQGFAVGMHAALHVNPCYGKTSTEGLISHFKEVLPMGPTIVYNVPSRTSQDIPPPVIEALSCYSNMAGVKECVGHERVKCYTDKGITIWSGNDDECHDSRWKYGATGVISVASNLVPGLMHSLMFEGENEALNKKLLPLMKWLFCEPNPIGLNTALAQLGVVRPVFRLPYTPLPLEKRVEFVRIVEAIGREKFVGQKEARVLDDDDFVLISRPSNPEGLQSIERFGKCISAGHVAIQSVEVEETELACYLRSGGLAPVTSGGNNFPKRTTGGKGTNIPLRRHRLFTLSFKESGQTSAVVIDIGEAQWIVDSGAAASLTGDSSLLEGLHTTEVMYFRVANGQIVSSNTCGRASGLVNLSGIRYSPGCHQNIISARHLINLGCVVNFDGEGCSIRKNGVLIGKAPPATEPEGQFYLDYLRDAQLGSICWACPHPTVQGN